MPLLRRYIIMDKVEVEDLSATISGIGMTGPKGGEILASLGIGQQQLGQLQFAQVTWNDATITLIRGDNPIGENYELWLSAENVTPLWNALLASGALEADPAALEAFRVMCGIPKVGLDIRERILPQETGQDRALNFNKGCYIGQEIVERIRARGSVHRMLVGFEAEGVAPQTGAKVQYEGKDVGEITSVASAPLNQKRLALGYLRKEAMAPGRTFVAGEATVKPASLPFSDIFG
jgi:folate-binding protein YgfZ